MSAAIFDIEPVAGAAPGHPIVEVRLRHSSRPGKPARHLDLDQWIYAPAEVREALDYVRRRDWFADHNDGTTSSRLRIPAAELDSIPVRHHAALQLPLASVAEIRLYLRRDRGMSFTWDLVHPGAKATDRITEVRLGFYRINKEWRYLVPGLQEMLDGMSLPHEGAPPSEDILARRAMGFLTGDTWAILRTSPSLTLHQITCLSFLVKLEVRYGVVISALPIRPDAPDEQAVFDPSNVFMDVVSDPPPGTLPKAISISGTPCYMSGPARDLASHVVVFNTQPFDYRAEKGVDLGGLLEAHKGRVVGRVRCFAKTTKVVEDIDDYPGLIAGFMVQQARYRGGRPLISVAPVQALTPGEMSEVEADFPLTGAVSARALDSTGAAGPATAGAEDPTFDFGYPDDGDDQPVSVGEGTGEGIHAAPAEGSLPAQDVRRDRRGNLRLFVASNIREVNIREQLVPRNASEPFCDKDLMALLATHDTSGKRLPLPRPHQVDIVRWFHRISEEGRAGGLVCDEQGTGKTWGLLMGMLSLGSRSDRPSLVVVEDHMTTFWEDELALRFRRYRFHKAYGDVFRRMDDDVSLMGMAGHRMVITTWHTLVDLDYRFAQGRFAVVVFDEASLAKNPRTLRTNALRSLDAELMVGATGTPVENGIGDLWSLMDIVRPGNQGSWFEFKAKWENSGLDRAGMAASLASELRSGECPVMLGRTKAELGLDLPAMHKHEVRCLMPPAQAAAYREAKGVAKNGVLSDPLRRISIHHDFAKLRSYGDRPTVEQAKSWLVESAVLWDIFLKIEKLRKDGKKAILFTSDIKWAQGPASIALGFALGLGMALPTVKGDDDRSKRSTTISQFKEANGFAVIMLSNKLGARGLTLTEAHVVIQISRWFNPAVEAQANNRAHRLGLDHEVDVYAILAVHPDPDIVSYDETLLALTKLKSIQGNCFTMPIPLTAEEVEAALRTGLRVVA